MTTAELEEQLRITKEIGRSVLADLRRREKVIQIMQERLHAILDEFGPGDDRGALALNLLQDIATSYELPPDPIK